MFNWYKKAENFMSPPSTTQPTSFLIGLVAPDGIIYPLEEHMQFWLDKYKGFVESKYNLDAENSMLREEFLKNGWAFLESNNNDYSFYVWDVKDKQVVDLIGDLFLGNFELPKDTNDRNPSYLSIHSDSKNTESLRLKLKDFIESGLSLSEFIMRKKYYLKDQIL